MKTTILLVGLAALLGFASCTSSSPGVSSSKQSLIHGVYQAGHNLTEPRPQRSEYLQTTGGGVAVVAKGSGLFLQTRVLKSPSRELYITVDYEGPGLTSLSNDMIFKPDARKLTFSAPRMQSDLRGFRDYTIIVRIWNSKSDKTPIDTLVQKVRSYVDTSGPTPRVFNGMKQQ